MLRRGQERVARGQQAGTTVEVVLAGLHLRFWEGGDGSLTRAREGFDGSAQRAPEAAPAGATVGRASGRWQRGSWTGIRFPFAACRRAAKSFSQRAAAATAASHSWLRRR